jgi:hypothetical protein
VTEATAGRRVCVVLGTPGPPRLITAVSQEHMRTKVTLLFALAFLLCIAGCVPPFHAIFINNTEGSVVLEVRDLEASKTFSNARTFQIPKGGSKRVVVSIPEVSLIGQSDRTHFRQVLPTFAPLADRFRGKDERKMYFLVTERGIYPIPTAWRDSWEEHQKEITSEFDLDAARQVLVREGLLKG